MAITGKIREKSGLLIGFIALALVIFILESALEKNSLFSGSKKNKVGKINGNSINIQDFDGRYRAYEADLKVLNPQLQTNEQISAQIRDQVWVAHFL